MTLQHVTERLEAAKRASFVKIQKLTASVESISMELEIAKARSSSLTTELQVVKEASCYRERCALESQLAKLKKNYNESLKMLASSREHNEFCKSSLLRVTEEKRAGFERISHELFELNVEKKVSDDKAKVFQEESIAYFNKLKKIENENRGYLSEIEKVTNMLIHVKEENRKQTRALCDELEAFKALGKEENKKNIRALNDELEEVKKYAYSGDYFAVNKMYDNNNYVVLPNNQKEKMCINIISRFIKYANNINEATCPFPLEENVPENDVVKKMQEERDFFVQMKANKDLHISIMNYAMRKLKVTQYLLFTTFLQDVLNVTHYTDTLEVAKNASYGNVATTNSTPVPKFEVTHKTDPETVLCDNDALGASLDNAATTTNSTPANSTPDPEIEVTHETELQDILSFTHDTDDALETFFDNIATTNIIPDPEIEVTHQSDPQERQNFYDKTYYDVGELSSNFSTLNMTTNNNDTTDVHDNVPVASKVQKLDETLFDVDTTPLSLDSNLNMTKNNNDTADAHDNVPAPSKVQKSDKTFSDVDLSPSSIDSNLNMTKNSNDTTDARDDVRIQSKVHKLWRSLTKVQRKHATVLGYTTESWNWCSLVDAHQYPWSSLNKRQKEAAMCLFNEKDWPCKMRENTSTNELSKKAPKKKCTTEKKENLNNNKQERKQTTSTTESNSVTIKHKKSRSNRRKLPLKN